MVQPPASLIPGGMVFGVMDGTERHGELIAHLQSEPLRLRIANVMSVRWRTAADEARLPGDKSQMLLRSMPLDLTKFEHALVDLFLARAGTSLLTSSLELGPVLNRVRFRFYEGDGAALQMIHKAFAEIRLQLSVLLQGVTQGSHRGDILLPHGKKELDALSVGHGLA